MMDNGYTLIVGGAGYIGSHVNKLLHRKGYETIIFDNLINGHREFVKWGEFILGDLSDKEQIRLCFKKYPIRAVMHFGAFAHVGESVVEPARYYHNNVVNTLHLLDAMLECNVKYFIFSSTCATYGNPTEIPITEGHPQNPINPYGKSKLMLEEMLKDYGRAYGLNYIILRYFNAAGADPDSELGEWQENESRLIPVALDVAMGRRDALEIFGTDYDTPDGTCIRDYIHVTDIAEAHILSLEYLLNDGKSEIFNLGNGSGFSVREVIQKAQEITGAVIKVVESQRRDGDSPIMIGSSEKAKNMLKWKPRYNDLDTIIGTAWKWRRKRIGN